MIKNLLTKILLGFIALSFAVWGVGDMFRGGISGGAYALRAEGKEVSLQTFQDEMRFRLATFRQMMGAGFTPDIAAKLGVDRQVINDLKTGLLMQIEAENLGIRFSEEEILAQVAGIDSFQQNGRFDKTSFQRALQQAGISESQFTESLQKELLANLLLSPYRNYKPAPELLNKAAAQLYAYRNESRQVELVRFVPPVSPEDSVISGDEALLDYYDHHSGSFRIPEYRKFSWVTLDSKALEASLHLNEEAVKALYQDRIAEFTTPEKREVSQLLYTSEAEAQKAYTALVNGESLAEIAKTLPPQNAMLSLGLVTPNLLPEEAREAVFALKGKSFTAPIQTDFGWHIFRTETIIEAHVMPFADVEKRLTAEWKAQQLEESLYTLTTALEDALAGGQSLAEAAAEYQLKPEESAFVSADGSHEQGSSGAALTDAMLRAGFELADSTIGVLLPHKAGDQSAIFLTLAEQKESYIPDFDTVKTQVEQALIARKMREARYVAAKEIAAKAKTDNGSALRGNGFRTETLRGLKRDNEMNLATIDEIPPALRKQIFTLAQGETSDAYLLNGKTGEYAIAKVTAIQAVTPASMQDKQAKVQLEAIGNELLQQYRAELVGHYLTALEQRYPIEVNQAAIRQMLQ